MCRTRATAWTLYMYSIGIGDYIEAYRYRLEWFIETKTLSTALSHAGRVETHDIAKET